MKKYLPWVIGAAVLFIVLKKLGATRDPQMDWGVNGNTSGSNSWN
jgi:hypothetical protein